MQDVLSAIATVGFPIVACIGLGWFSKYMMDNYRADMQKANEEHREETAKLAEAVNNNTIAIKELMTMLNRED